MILKLYNSTTSQKEDFKSISPNIVSMYCCGPTVYDAPHLGNFRTFVFYDLVKRVLVQNGFEVNQVINITDIDDKIINKVNSGEIGYKELTAKFNDVFLKHSLSLNIQEANQYPKTSDHVGEMIGFIKALIDKEYAYNVDGNIFFDTEKYSKYGKFVNIENIDGLESEDDGLGKKNQKDFALWKAWKDEDGDITWESEWGNGRPAWHTECAVLATQSLGNTIDIHCGGVDLKFPHHENESAQVEALLDSVFSNYWLHSEHLILEEEKMSKSLGNILSVSDLLNQYSAETIRLFLLSSHYRSKIYFSDEKLSDSSKMIDKINRFVKSVGLDTLEHNGDANLSGDYLRFVESLNDDLNTPEALGIFFDFINKKNKKIHEDSLSEKDIEESKKFILGFNSIFQIINPSVLIDEKIPEEVQKLVSLRGEMRDKKNWEEADRLREEIEKMGWLIEDSESSQKLVRKK